MFRILGALLGLAIFGAIFAGIYYSDTDVSLQHDERPAFNLAPGEVRSDAIQPSLAGAAIRVEINTDQPIDLWVMSQEWAASIAKHGKLNLSQPFSFYSHYSQVNITGNHLLFIESDGFTWHTLVFDYSNAYYNDTAPGTAPAQVQVNVRFIEEESKTLLLGYLAVTPCVLLVIATLVRQYRRRKPPA